MKSMPIQERATVVAYFPWEYFTPADEAQAMENHGQTLTRLAQRSGLGICELVAVLDHRPWRKMKLGEAWTSLWAIASQRIMNNVA